jgi:hypothetical protein
MKPMWFTLRQPTMRFLPIPQQARSRVRPARSGYRHLALASLLLLAHTGSPGAESMLEMPYPKTVGEIPASTYDLDLQRLGPASVQILRLEDGNVTMDMTSGVEGGAKNVLRAVMEPIGDASDPKLRLVHERSQSFDPSGKPLVILEIDHRKGVATCTPPGGDGSKTKRVELPADDRVANVPLNLLFVPLVEGKVERMEFQVFLCLGGARILKFAATVSDIVGRTDAGEKRVRKIEYGPDEGKVFNWLASAVGPSLVFWFDLESEDLKYIAHQMPLYSRGPEVVILREGFPTSILGSLKN